MPGRLATTLAARGAGNPEALAAFLSSRAATGARVLGFAQGGGNLDDEGSVMTCPRCGYTGRDFGGGPGGVSDSGQQAALRTPAPGTGYVRSGAPLTVRGAAGGMGPGLANTGGGINLAAPRLPVTSQADLIVSNHPEGGAVIRHRRGGTEIGRIVNDGGWKAVYGGKAQQPHDSSRGALAELLGLWNTGTTTLQHPGAPAAQPQQTPLMQQFGVPAVNALATPSTGYASGPRVTTSAASGSSDDDDDDDNGKGSGLTPKGQAIKKKLMAKGWPDAKADMFARRAQSFGGSKS